MNPIVRRGVAALLAAALLGTGLALTSGLLLTSAPPAAAAGSSGVMADSDWWPYPDEAVDPRAPVNGCGSQGEDGTDVPDEWFGTSFTDACNWHDRCYGTKGHSQSYCDLGMWQRSMAACDGHRGCRGMAHIYFMGVSAFGGDPYRNGQQAACEKDPNRDGRVHGDPHLETIDGRHYSLMTAGEFALVRDADGRDLVQARFHPQTDSFTVVSGLAVRLGESEVVVAVDPEDEGLTVHVDGELVTGAVVAFDDGLVEMGIALVGVKRVVRIRGWDGFLVEALVYDDRLDLSVHLPEPYWGEVSGILGDADGDPTNDLVDRNGQIVPRDVSSVDLNSDDDVKDAFRIDPADSMFTPDPDGFDYHGKQARRYPIVTDPMAAFDQMAVAAARERCAAVGLEGAALEACAFDVLVGGDERYADQAARSAARARDISHPHGSGDGHRTDDGALILVPRPPLVAAVEADDIDEVRALLADGADIDVGRESDGLTPLLTSLIMGHDEITELLLDRGADPSIVRSGQTSPLQIAVVGDRSADLVRRLLEAGADPDPPAPAFGVSNPLPTAVGVQRLDLVELLLEFGADPDGGEQLVSPLYLAAGLDDLRIARRLLDAGADPNRGADEGAQLAPLRAAVAAGNVDGVRLLLDAGAERRTAVPTGLTLESLTDDPEILRLLGAG